MAHDSQEINPYSAAHIPNWAERTFARIVAAIPHLRVTYQPPTINTPMGPTQPDFRVVNGKNPGSRGRYVEVTSGGTNTLHKKEQKNKMESAGKPYNQFSGDEIVKMEKARKRKSGV